MSLGEKLAASRARETSDAMNGTDAGEDGKETSSAPMDTRGPKEEDSKGTDRAPAPKNTPR
jgi:hypothetical protein